jgi:hypothetical protein
MQSISRNYGSENRCNGWDQGARFRIDGSRFMMVTMDMRWNFVSLIHWQIALSDDYFIHSRFELFDTPVEMLCLPVKRQFRTPRFPFFRNLFPFLFDNSTNIVCTYHSLCNDLKSGLCYITTEDAQT